MNSDMVKPEKSRHLHLVYHFTLPLKGSTTVPIKSVDDKRQTTATFTVSAKGVFLPIQLIYQSVTERYLPKYKFPKEFIVTYAKNHWSNLEKCVDLFEKIILTSSEKD